MASRKSGFFRSLPLLLAGMQKQMMSQAAGVRESSTICGIPGYTYPGPYNWCFEPWISLRCRQLPTSTFSTSKLVACLAA